MNKYRRKELKKQGEKGQAMETATDKLDGSLGDIDGVIAELEEAAE